jgi:transcriptional regulator with XRE-family HTH domain
MSKAFKKTGAISDNVKEAFRELEKELGLTEGALSNFENAFTKLIDSLDLEDKTFGGLNKPELLEQIKKSKFGEYMSEDMTNWLGMIFGEKAVDGNTFWETGLSAIGDGFGRLGDFMNFEMIGQGLDMANTAKGIVD